MRKDLVFVSNLKVCSLLSTVCTTYSCTSNKWSRSKVLLSSFYYRFYLSFYLNFGCAPFIITLSLIIPLAVTQIGSYVSFEYYSNFISHCPNRQNISLKFSEM